MNTPLLPASAGALFRPRRSLIQAAQWCGLAPALIGTVILLSWAATSSTLMPLLGVLNVLLGIALFGVGLGLVGATYMQAGRRLLPGCGVALALMLANFPLAAGYAVLGMKLEEHRMREHRCAQWAQAQPTEPTGLADARRQPCPGYPKD